MERGSIVDAQITLDEEIRKEIERCKDYRYYYINYIRIVRVDGELVKPPFRDLDYYMMIAFLDIKTNKRVDHRIYP